MHPSLSNHLKPPYLSLVLTPLFLRYQDIRKNVFPKFNLVLCSTNILPGKEALDSSTQPGQKQNKQLPQDMASTQISQVQDFDTHKSAESNLENLEAT